jgi:hypothetical protein
MENRMPRRRPHLDTKLKNRRRPGKALPRKPRKNVDVSGALARG